MVYRLNINNMKTYQVTYSTTIEVEAKNEQDAEKKAVDLCARDSEYLMPHNMECEVMEEGQI
jgi:hypothetical protein